MIRFAWTLSFLLLAWGGRAQDPEPSAASPVDRLLEELDRGFSEIRTVQADFRQEKELAVFSRPLVLEGRLRLEIPGRLAWHVDTPLRYALVIDGDVMKQWDEETGKIEQTSMSGHPVLRVVDEQLRSWFSGRYASLQADYEARVVEAQPLELEFIPRASSPARRMIARVVVNLREDRRYVSRIRIEDSGGDATTLTFARTVLNEPIDEGAWALTPAARSEIE